MTSSYDGLLMFAIAAKWEAMRVFAVVGFAYLQAGLTDGRVARQVGADDGRYPFVLAVAAAGRIINYD